MRIVPTPMPTNPWANTYRRATLERSEFRNSLQIGGRTGASTSRVSMVTAPTTSQTTAEPVVILRAKRQSNDSTSQAVTGM